jgi:LysM repeat protein
VQTLKTAVVVVLLLVVFYGVYEMLNRPPDAPPAEVARMEDMPFDPPEVQFGETARNPVAEPAVSVPAVTTNGAVESPVPSYTMAPADSQYSSSSFPVAGPPNLPTDQPPGEPEYPLTVEPPSPTVPGTPVTSAGPGPPPPLAGQNLTAPDASEPRLQRNPFLQENVVVRPSGMADQVSSDQIGVRAYERARKLAKMLVEEGKYHEALATLSVFYQSPDLTPAEHRELLDLLDPLAGRVIYSREHLVAPSHTVRRNETLADIAKQYNVPMELLRKINGIETPNVLVPGTELKVVTGPFRAEVNLQAQELTLFLNGLYAGRFPITIGRDPAPVAGDFKVREKREDRDYFSMEGRKIPAGNPANPFGNVWLDLGREVCIHGSPTGGADPQRGCISLSPQDANDVYGILSIGSAVRILR